MRENLFYGIGKWEIKLNQSHLSSAYGVFYNSTLYGGGLCYGITTVIREKLNSNHAKNSDPKAIIGDYLNRIQEVSTARPLNYLYYLLGFSVQSPLEHQKTKKLLLRTSTNQHSLQEFNKKFSSAIDFIAITKEKLSEELQDKVCIPISICSVPPGGSGHEIAIIRDTEEGKVRIFDPNFGLSKTLTLDEAIFQLNEKFPQFYKLAYSELTRSTTRMAHTLNSPADGVKVHRAKPYHLVQIMLGEITRVNSKLKVSQFYQDLGEELVNYVVDSCLRDAAFRKMKNPLKPEEARRRLQEFGFRKKEVIGIEFKEEGRDNKGNTELHAAINSKQANIRSEIVTRLANEPNYDFEYPIHTAAKVGDVKRVSNLLKHGKANVNQLTKDLLTPLHFAARVGKDVIKKLVSNGANIGAKTSTGKTPLHLAAIKGCIEGVETLLTLGADLNVTDNSGATPLHYAAQKGHTLVAESLIKNGANVKAIDNSRRTALHDAAESNNLSLAELLVKKGADVNACDEYGTTPLHLAVKEPENLEVVKFLIANGAKANINAGNRLKSTALHEAAMSGNLEIVCYLVENGADIKCKDYCNLTALHIAVKSRKLEIVRYLVENGANLEERDWDDEHTALAIAAELHEPDILQYLISKGANVNSRSDVGRNRTGYTPLMIAVFFNSIEAVAELLNHNEIDVFAKNDQGHTALDLCQNPRIEKLIEDFIKAKSERSQVLIAATQSSSIGGEIRSTLGSTVVPNQGVVSSSIVFAVLQDIAHTLTYRVTTLIGDILSK